MPCETICFAMQNIICPPAENCSAAADGNIALAARLG
jgi:hypothetical protein